MSFVFERWPVRVSRDEYESVATEIERRLAEVPGVVSVYSFGAVTALGISDVDRIAVVAAQPGPIRSIWPSMSGRQRYIALHTPFLVDTETFGRHRWFAYLSNLERCHGEPVEIEQPQEAELLSTALGLEGLVSTRIQLERIRFVQRVKVRSFLCELHNLRLDLELLRLHRSATPAAWLVADRVAGLRSDWWNLDRHEQIRNVSELIHAAIEGVDDALRQYRHEKPEHRPETFSLVGHWRNVHLRVGGSRALGMGTRVPLVISRRSRRASEFRWRSSQHHLGVSEAVLGLLDRYSRPTESALRERREIVDRYAAFADASHGWSKIGLAEPFLP